ncbi:MAG: CoA transferase [Aliidongia sp.]
MSSSRISGRAPSTGWGLGYKALKAENPGLIYCSISGFGHSGPYRERGGFDLVAQAMSGIMSFTGVPGGDRPVAAGVPLSDLNAGCFGALGILAALNHRRGDRRGPEGRGDPAGIGTRLCRLGDRALSDHGRGRCAARLAPSPGGTL